MSAYEEPADIIREDGVNLPGVWINPDGEAAQRCKSAGVIVVGGEHGLRATDRERFVTPLGELGYFVVAFGVVGGVDIDDLVAGILACKQLTAHGRLGVIGIGSAGAIAIEAATMVPHIDAVVAVDAPPPSPSARLSRLRAAINVHRAEAGTLFTAANFEDLERRARRSKAQLLCNSYPARDGFFTTPRDPEEEMHARIAWDKTRDFLSYALT
jgi:hypothetical protein